jgi:dipeptidyl aminopeptidase/acylaminoacyl peptidase
MVLNVHGGPWYSDTWGFGPENQFLANRGYAVLQVNYRGSTGYGKTFAQMANHQFARKMHDDLIDAVNWVVAKGIADPKRVAIYGGSYGGYAALVGLTFTPDFFACGVDICGPTSLITLIKSFPPYWRPFLHARWYRYVGNPDDPAAVEDLKARSPLYHIENIKRPLFIAQGANDVRVTKAESDRIVEALRAAGKEVEYMVAANEGHGFANPENRIEFYRRVEAFLAKHIGGRKQD